MSHDPEALAVLADYLDQHEYPMRAPASISWRLSLQLARIKPQMLERVDYAMEMAIWMSIDGLWEDAPPVLRQLLSDAGLMPRHGPECPRDVLGRNHQRKVNKALADTTVEVVARGL